MFRNTNHKPSLKLEPNCYLMIRVNKAVSKLVLVYTSRRKFTSGTLYLDSQDDGV